MLIYSKIKIKKQPNQNIFDFVLTNYGKLDYLNTYFTDNSVEDIESFDLLANGTEQIINPDNNTELIFFNKNNIIVTTSI